MALTQLRPHAGQSDFRQWKNQENLDNLFYHAPDTCRMPTLDQAYDEGRVSPGHMSFWNRLTPARCGKSTRRRH